MYVFLFLCFIATVYAYGEYIPQYENNQLKPMQCHGSTGYCWCIYGPDAFKKFRNPTIVCPKKKYYNNIE